MLDQFVDFFGVWRNLVAHHFVQTKRPLVSNQSSRFIYVVHFGKLSVSFS